jgi:pimeloyl-ACP methyl ester carboxylesterase
MTAAPTAAPPAGAPEIAGAERRTVTIQTHDAGPLDIHLYEAGSGPPVLLLHGWPEVAWAWRHVFPLLSDRFRLIAPDLRGFGWSGAPGQGYDGFTFGLDAVALLDALEIEKAHVIGHDWGGFAAFAVGITHPQRIERMVVLNTLPPWVERSPRLLLESWRSIYAFVMAGFGERIVGKRPSVIARMVRADRVHDAISREDAMVYGRAYQRPESAYATQQLYRSYVKSIREVGIKRRFDDLRLSVPTHFLFGKADKAVSYRLLAGMERHCDDLTLELVPDSGHFIAEEKPELVAQRARDFFLADS